MNIFAKTEENFLPVSSNADYFISMYICLTVICFLLADYFPVQLSCAFTLLLMCIYRHRYVGQSGWMAALQFIPLLNWAVAIWLFTVDKE